MNATWNVLRMTTEYIKNMYPTVSVCSFYTGLHRRNQDIFHTVRKVSMMKPLRNGLFDNSRICMKKLKLWLGILYLCLNGMRRYFRKKKFATFVRKNLPLMIDEWKIIVILQDDLGSFLFFPFAVQNFCLISIFNYRGAAHNKCNLDYQISRSIPVIFHNLSGYDSHLFIKELVTSGVLPGNVTVIPLNKKRYISFSTHFPTTATAPGKRPIRKYHISFKFLHSFRFMASSLDKLASFISDMPIVTKEFQKDKYTADQINLLKRKGVFP